MTSLERRMTVLCTLRQEYEDNIPDPYRREFLRDIDRRIDQLQKAMNAGGLPPIAPRLFEGRSDDY